MGHNASHPGDRVSKRVTRFFGGKRGDVTFAEDFKEFLREIGDPNTTLLNKKSFAELEKEFGESSADRAIKAFTNRGEGDEIAGHIVGGQRFVQGARTADLRTFLEDAEFTEGDLGSSERGELAERITSERIVRAKATTQAEELAKKQQRSQSSLIRLQTQQQRRQQAGGLRSGVLTSPRGLTGSNSIRLGIS